MSGPLLRLWLPVAAWAGLIFAFSSVPDLGTGLGGWDLVLRKLAHAARVRGARSAAPAGDGSRWVSPSLLGALYAATDELHQVFVPGRMGSPLDVAIDVVGVAGGVLLWQRTLGVRRAA